MRRPLMAAVLATGLAARAVAAPPTAASFPYPAGEEIHLRVARTALVSGEASVARGDDPGVWRKVRINLPVIVGDRIRIGAAGRVELELQGQNLIELGPGADVLFSDLSQGSAQLAVLAGSISVIVRRSLEDERIEIDAPNAAARMVQSGNYGVEVRPDRVQASVFLVRRGEAVVAAGGGELSIPAGRQILVEGRDSPRYDVSSAPDAGDWEHWVEDRERRQSGIRSAAYVHPDVVGVADLDRHGRWENTPDFGYAWTPSGVAKGWQPYREGRWSWQDPWGWTWISDEPWGWAPYHYGRWANYPTGWYWVPDGPTSRYVAYAPALVAFLGGGGDGSEARGFRGGALAGWFPLALADPFYPWWIPRLDVHLTRVTDFVYRNRAHVTVVPQSVFRGGRSVREGLVRDRNALAQAAAAPVLRVPLPLVPTTASLSAARSAVGAMARPDPARPASVVGFAVPPPPPPSLRAKLPAIEENRGAPVPQSVALQIARASGPAQAAVSTQILQPNAPVALAPMRAESAGPRPRPITPLSQSLPPGAFDSLRSGTAGPGVPGPFPPGRSAPPRLPPDAPATPAVVPSRPPSTPPPASPPPS